MSKDRMEELMEQMERDEEYRLWYEEQVALGQEASEQEYLKWYLQTKMQKSRPHASKEIPAKIGTRKHALVSEKSKVDRKEIKRFAKSKRINKMIALEENLLMEAEAMFTLAEEYKQKGLDNTLETDRSEELFKEVMAVEDRRLAEDKQKRYNAKKAKEKRNYRKHQATDSRVFSQVVEETWGQERGEFATLADKQLFEKRSAAAKKGAETKKANQRASDYAYEQWYLSTNEGKGK